MFLELNIELTNDYSFTQNTMQKDFSQTPFHQSIKWLLWLVCGIFICSSIFLWFVETNDILKYISLNHKPNAIQLQKISLLISDSKLLYIKFLAFSFTISFILITRFQHTYISSFIYKLYLQIKSLFESNTWQAKAAVSIVLIFKIAFIFYLPLHLDEFFSYLFLSSKGFLVSISYYPGPNNHVAYNVLSAICQLLPLPTILAIRLPSLIADIFILLICIRLFKKYISNPNYIFAIVHISFSINYLPFSIAGRGYTLQALFGLVGLISVLKWEKDKTFYTSIFIIFNTLGFWLLPTHLFVFGSLFLLSIYLYKNYLNVLISSSITALLSLALYSPILILNGVQSITGNAWVKSLTRAEFNQKVGSFLIKYIETIVGVNHIAIAGLVLVGGIGCLIFFKKYKELVILLIFILSPIAIIFMQKVTPFPRVFIYLNLLFTIWLIYFFVKYRITLLLVLFIMIQCFTMYSFSKEMIRYKIENRLSMSEKNELITSWTNEKIEKVLVKEELQAYQLAYLAKQNNINIDIKWDQTLTTNYYLIKHK